MATFESLLSNLSDNKKWILDQYHIIRDSPGGAKSWLKDLSKNDFDHATAVEEYIVKIIQQSHIKLSPEEILLLFYSVYLHDIGYRDDPKNHAQKSYEKIRAYFDNYFISDRHLAEAIAIICQAHDVSRDIDDVEDEFPIPFIDRTETINLRFLSSLLRLADDLDQVYLRVMNRSGQETSPRHDVYFVKIGPQNIEIKIELKFQNKLDVLEEYFSSVQKNLDRIKHVLKLRDVKIDTVKVIFPDQKKNNKIIIVPLDQNRGFVGRENYLKDLKTGFSDPKIPVIVLYGHAGIGKTQIALEYAYRFEAKYNYIWWIASEDNTALEENFDIIGRDLLLRGFVENNLENNRKLIRKWLQSNDNWLIIFDNVISYQDIKAYIPPRIKGNILISSRDHRWKESGYHAIKIDELPLDKAIELLETKSGRSDNFWAEKIAKELDNIPLALSHAGAYIYETQCEMKEYFTLLSCNNYEILDESPSGPEYRHSVVKTIEISLNNISKKSLNAINLMYFFSFLAPDNIPLNIFKDERFYLPESLRIIFSNSILLNKELKELLSYSLIERNGDFVSVHRLDQKIIRYSLVKNTELFQEWNNEIIKILESLIKEYNNGNSEIKNSTGDIAPLISMAVSHLKIDKSISGFFSRFLTSSGDILNELTHYKDAKNCYERALEIDEKLYGPESTIIVIDLINLGLILQTLGEFQGAKKQFEQALNIDETKYGAESSNVTTDLTYLGRVLQNLGRYKEAKEYFERAIEINEKEEGSEDFRVATNLADLGRVLRDLGRYKEAKEYFERTLKISEKKYKPEHLKVANYLNNLGLILQDLGQYQEAKEKFDRALAIEEKEYGPQHPEVATILNNIGLVLQDLGQYQDAKENLDRALAIDEKVYGPQHPKVATRLNNIGYVLTDLGQYQEAKENFERVLAIEEKVYGPQHPEVATILNNIGLVLQDLGQYQEAKENLDRALVIDEKVYGPQHPKVATRLNNIGYVLTDLGQYQEAKENFERALAIDEKVYGLQHPKVATRLDNIGYVLTDLGQYQEAKENLVRALAIHEKVYGPQHPKVATRLNNLGRVLNNLDRYQEAKENFERAIQIDEKVFGSSHPKIARDTNNLGIVLHCLKEYNVAKEYFQRALQIGEKFLGSSHPTVITIRNNLNANSQEIVKFIRI